ncbi:MAG: DUF349 domain-containing protein [Prevotella sp.]|nr:DUF349 domain-containing protein [Prevotella sp.]
MDSQDNTFGSETVSQKPDVEQSAGTQQPENQPQQMAAEELSQSQEAVSEPLPMLQEDEEVAGGGEDETVNNGEPRKKYKTKLEVLGRVKEMAHSDEIPSKEEADYLKTTFYKLHNAEREAQMKEYLDGGGNPDNYRVMPDDVEEMFKAEMGIIKEKRAKQFQEQEALKERNLQRKLEIIESIKAMVTSPEEVNKSYQEFKNLQQEWKEIKTVPAEKANELWRNYQLYVEQFYDLFKLNIEAREYDFKKNYEKKIKLCETAERLAEENDVISAFHQLNELHQEYRETGPVAKELREEIWARFKAASTAIHKRHQQHFEELRAKENENLERKTALCEKVEAIAQQENNSATDWENRSKEIIDIQAEWKTIGYAPQKMNVKIFERFRAACDDFFNRKNAYYKEKKKKYAENAEKKRALVEKAKALQDSTDWKATSDKLINLQKEWKTIGMVPGKTGDMLWEEFLGACNKFFEARNQATAGTRNEERENLSAKRAIIDKLETLAVEGGENVHEQVKQLADEYNNIGHVPYKEKDKLYKAYRSVLDKLYEGLHISIQRRKLDNFKSNLKDMVKRGEEVLDNERSRLMRRYEALRQEIQTYENNLGFLNASSKKGNSLVDELNRKVEKLKDDLKLVRDKIKAIDSENAAEENKE